MRRWISLVCLPLCAAAQSPMPTEFPPDAVTESGDALRARVSGKVFSVQPAQGASWRLEYRANGFLFIETSQGFRDTGTWRIEDDKLCGHWQKSGSSCSDARVKDGVLYVKRTSNGEVVVLRAP